MMDYEYRILQKRSRWTMNNPYEEWFRPTGCDYTEDTIAQLNLEQLRADHPDQVFKLQHRPKVQDWEDIE